MPVNLKGVRRMLGCAAVVVAALAWSGSASAGIPAFQVIWEVNGAPPVTLMPEGTQIGANLFNYQGTYVDPSGLWTGTFNFNGDPDPVLSGNLEVENLSGMPLTVVATFLLPITPIPGGTLIGGSASFGMTSDSEGGTLATIPGTPAWQAMIDGTTVATLFDDPFSLSNPGLGSVGASEDFGTPIPSDPGPPALSNISIQISFTLTPFDQASITSVFVVIPAPAGAALLGVAGLIGRRRRRTA